jgi:hypothetical protein
VKPHARWTYFRIRVEIIDKLASFLSQGAVLYAIVDVDPDERVVRCEDEAESVERLLREGLTSALHGNPR